MPHIIAEPCLGTKDVSCVDVCPVDCIHPTKNEKDFETADQLYIDPDTCIDCGACVPECPFAAIFPEDEVPAAYTAKGGEYISNVGLTGHYEAANHHGKLIALETTRQLQAGEVVDMTPDIQPNYDFFKGGPGYGAKDADDGT
jgi:ferredoxin